MGVVYEGNVERENTAKQSLMSRGMGCRMGDTGYGTETAGLYVCVCGRESMYAALKLP